MPDLKIPVPSVRGYQGRFLDTFQTQVSPDQAVHLLGHDPRPDKLKGARPEVQQLYKNLQRTTTKARKESLKKYAIDRFSTDAISAGAIPAISVAIKYPPTFTPFDPKNPDVGTLDFPLGDDNPKVILDGVGRVTALLELIEDEKHKGIGKMMTIPVTIYAPNEHQREFTEKQQGQVFHDFNMLGTPLSKAHAMALDSHDPLVELTNKLAETPVIVENGGMVKRVDKPGAKSEALVSQKHLFAFVRAACEGRTSMNAGKGDTKDVTQGDIAPQLERIEAMLTGLANAMGERFANDKSLMLSSAGWQALGRLFFDISNLCGDDVDVASELIEAIGEVDWLLGNPEWKGVIGDEYQVVRKKDKPDEQVLDSEERPCLKMQRSGSEAVKNILNYVRKKIGLDQTMARAAKQAVPTAAKVAGEA